MAKAIMLQGTASGVGKTVLTLALCRIFQQDGLLVTPFKAQNMTSYTCQTKQGDEIAVSQWIQAQAAKTEPIKDMNPIVLKPPFSRALPRDKETKLEVIMGAYSRLKEKYDVIVIEGAGSPVELNLNKDDLINMGMAKRAKAPVLLISDISRGGVFASLYGTASLVDESEKKLLKGTIVNRFKGDISCFADGVKILGDITKLPVIGVIPFTEIRLPEEDSLSAEEAGPLAREQNFFENGEFTGHAELESQIDRIAESVRKHLNMELVYDILNKGVE